MSKTYQRAYKQNYKQKNKVISFPLSNAFYDELHRKSVYYDLSVNTYSKQVVTNFLNGKSENPLTKDRVSFIKEYMQISRGIATNINQLAYKANINETIDINILITSLKHYEDEFKKFISKA